MLLPSGNPFKCHQEVLYLQPMIPPKRFDILTADWGMLRRSRCVQIFFKHEDFYRLRAQTELNPLKEPKKNLSQLTGIFIFYLLVRYPAVITICQNPHELVTEVTCPYSCVCVCVFFPSILDIKFVGRTSRGHTGGRSHRIFNPPSFCGACLDFCREKDSAVPFPRRP